MGDAGGKRDRRSVYGHSRADFNPGDPNAVEVQIDNGAWQQATLDSSNTRNSWKLFTYRWEGVTPGEHTLVSRATDVNAHTYSRRGAI